MLPPRERGQERLTFDLARATPMVVGATQPLEVEVMVVAARAQGLQVVDLERLAFRGLEGLLAAGGAEPTALALVDEGEHGRREVAGCEPATIPATPLTRVERALALRLPLTTLPLAARPGRASTVEPGDPRATSRSPTRRARLNREWRRDIG